MKQFIEALATSTFLGDALVLIGIGGWYSCLYSFNEEKAIRGPFKTRGEAQGPGVLPNGFYNEIRFRFRPS